MTGYGMGEVSTENFNCTIELKSVNNRYCDIQIRMPKAMLPLEELIRKEIKKQISRGKVDVYINYQVFGQDSTFLVVDHFLLEKYIQEMNHIRENFHLHGEIDINNIIDFEGVFQLEPNKLDVEKIRSPFEVALKVAIDKLLDMRKTEGKTLKNDLKEKIEAFEPHIKFLEDNGPRLLEENKEKFLERFHSLVGKEDFDLPRLTTELTIMSDKLCIDEEITRISSHISQFSDIMNRNNPIGRKLDFLLQELHREVNTIGSKTADLLVTNHVVEMKSIIEQMREQVQNIE